MAKIAHFNSTPFSQVIFMTKGLNMVTLANAKVGMFIFLQALLDKKEVSNSKLIIFDVWFTNVYNCNSEC